MHTDAMGSCRRGFARTLSRGDGEVGVTPDGLLGGGAKV